MRAFRLLPDALALYAEVCMKAVRMDLPRNLTCVEIHAFADFHIGDRGCDIESIKRKIARVKDTENAYCILNGDIINNATRTSVSDSYAEMLTPMQQISMFTELFEPIKDKILVMTSGNHEDRTYRADGIDITEVCARQLGIGDRYSSTGALLFLRFGTYTEHNDRPLCYTFYCVHGTGGGRKEGSKAIRLADMASIIDADIYIHSHTHLPMVMKQSFFRTDVRNSSFEKITKLFVNTSAMLDYGGYGEKFEFKPSCTDSPVIYLDGRRKKFSAEL